MSKNRLIARRSSTGIRPKWGSQCIEPDQLDTVCTMITKPLPVGQSPDAVQLYGYHDIYGTIHFTGGDDLRQFVTTTANALKIDTTNNYLVPSANGAVYASFQPAALDAPWDQPLDATQVISLRVPYFKVNAESVLKYFAIKFNVGEDKGGGANYAMLKVVPDVTTGSPNQNKLNFNLNYVNYGTEQDTDTYSGLRKYPDYTGTDLGYEIQFWLDETTERAYVKIIPDQGAEDTLYVTAPPGLDYCDAHNFMIYVFWNDSASFECVIDWFRILKAAGEDTRITYKLSRDGGTTWTSKVGDTWMTSGYDTASVDISAQPAGNKTLMLKIELLWPAIVKGYGMALGGS